ncbi:hypothetical protein JHD50_00715 [Sulfurimonas sp. MAG313]|nr:hypothetical protein [Sulfurimonas sp. MAG313]MDF1879835.1 hypothetical protein [Sulfurimonas sp. MAG313]
MKLLSTLIIPVLLSISALAVPQKDDVKFTPTDNKTLAVVWTHEKNNDKEFFEFAKKDAAKLGFFLNDPHHNVQTVYEQQFGETHLDNIAFNSLVNDKDLRPLLNIDPRIGGFNPFNLLTFRKDADGPTTVAHITPEAALDILEITDPRVREPYIAMFKPLDKAIDEKLGGKKSLLALKGRAKDTMLNFEIAFDEPEDIDDFMDEFQEKFESTFETKGYIIAGFYNVKDSFNSDEDVLPDYVTFWAYDLCHIEFSYNVFDGKNGVPMAGIFAPCSMYVYVREGENKIVIGMPSLRAWSGALGMTDPKKLDIIDKLDIEITEIIVSFGGKVMPNGNPLNH